MAESVAYFLEKGVASLSVSPVHAPAENGLRGRLDEMEAQFERIGDLSLSHVREHGEVPLLFLRGDGGPPPHPWRGRTMCGVTHGRSVAVDVDGSVYGCAMLIEGASARIRPWLAAELSRLRVGHIDDPSPEAFLRRFAERAMCSAILTHKERKHSGLARCATCRAIGACDLCPVSIGLMPENDDPDRVPDFACAFYRTAFRTRERFRREAGKIPARGSPEALGEASG
jgi:hypothetical protein